MFCNAHFYFKYYEKRSSKKFCFCYFMNKYSFKIYINYLHTQLQHNFDIYTSGNDNPLLPRARLIFYLFVQEYPSTAMKSALLLIEMPINGFSD